MRVNSQVAGNLTSKVKRIPLKHTVDVSPLLTLSFSRIFFSMRFNNMKNEKKRGMKNLELQEKKRRAEEDNEKSIFKRDGGYE
jgi:hypothetical protein